MKNPGDIVIVSYARTPLGSFLGSLAQVPASELGAVAIRGALNKIGLDPSQVDEVFMGNVLQAGVGQAPARQAALKGGIPDSVPATTINKVCSSGLKSVMLAASQIRAGEAGLMVAGGMENMSLAPHYLQARRAVKLGDIKAVDGLIFDGLTDAFHHQHMGVFADKTAKEYGISREEQDAYAAESYKRAAKAWAEGRFKDEVVPVEIPQRKGDPVIFAEDEEYKNVKFDKMPKLRPVFTPDGTVTAANASTINDGGAALVLTTRARAEELGLKPLARILSYADAANPPEWFTTAPAKAIPKALEKAGLSLKDIDFFEVNEAFAVVALVTEKLLGLPHDRTNVHGGAVSLGHPLGVSGARILMTLVNILHQYGGRYGAIGICNGGGGASAMVIERE